MSTRFLSNTPSAEGEGCKRSALQSAAQAPMAPCWLHWPVRETCCTVLDSHSLSLHAQALQLGAIAAARSDCMLKVSPMGHSMGAVLGRQHAPLLVGGASSVKRS